MVITTRPRNLSLKSKLFGLFPNKRRCWDKISAALQFCPCCDRYLFRDGKDGY